MMYLRTCTKEQLLELSHDRLEELLYAPRYYDPETFDTFVVDQQVRYNLEEIVEARRQQSYAREKR